MSPIKNAPGKNTLFYHYLRIYFLILATAYLGEGDEPYPSLSDYHDYEPNLEFDDTELHQTPDTIAHTGM